MIAKPRRLSKLDQLAIKLASTYTNEPILYVTANWMTELLEEIKQKQPSDWIRDWRATARCARKLGAKV